LFSSKGEGVGVGNVNLPFLKEQSSISGTAKKSSLLAKVLSDQRSKDASGSPAISFWSLIQSNPQEKGKI
jgi:hypothetical protein